MNPIKRLGEAITKAGYEWNEEMTQAYNDAMEMMSKPMNGDQVMKLWQQSNGNPIRFASLMESWHGLVPSIFEGE
jgi:hypothetical protein